MKVKSEREVAQLCPTLSDRMDCSLPGSSVHRSFQARVLKWVAIALSRSKANISYKNSPKINVDLNVKHKTIYLFEKNVGEKTSDL